MANNLAWTLVILIGIGLFLIYHFTSKAIPDNSPVVINPVSGESKKECTKVRTPCDINDPNSCNTSCTEEALTCVSLNSIQGSSNINGGGHVCLPSPVGQKCDITKGGTLVWSGYGFTNRQEWDCLCTKPEYYVGSDCTTPNPAFCTGGNANGYDCSCPANTIKLYDEITNLPFCASKISGGGENGLAGNLEAYPSWKNIYLAAGDWYRHVAEELYYQPSAQDVSTVAGILGRSTQLTPTLATQLCGQVDPSRGTPLCSAGLPVNFPTSFDPRVSYTYYTNAYFA